MSRRRAKLSSEDRARRAEKRARRAEGASEREARRRVRAALARPTAARERLRSAMLAYTLALNEGLWRERGEVELVVCARCGLLQSNARGTCDMPGIDGWPPEAQRSYGSGLVEVSPCQSVGCDSVEAISIERYEAEYAPA